MKRPKEETDLERFILWADFGGDENECVEWLGNISKRGYGRFRVNGIKRTAQDAAYELFKGLVPDGLEIDHTCHSEAVNRGECVGGFSCLHRRCVNPYHLEAVTRQVNKDRAVKTESKKEYCQSGRHKMAETRIVKGTAKGSRCRECWNEYQRSYRRKTHAS